MTSHPYTPSLVPYWSLQTRGVIEVLWLLTVFLVPLMFVTPGIMANGYDIPKVTLYRSLVGLMCSLWIIEAGLARPAFLVAVSRLSPSLLREWLLAQPGRWVMVAAWMLVASSLISTLLSPSILVSLWGSEPALDGNSFYNTLSHFLLFLVLATHLKSAAQLWRLLGAITASGVAVGFYALVQYYGLDPFGIHGAGAGVVSSLGNPIFAGAFLLLVAPMILALALKTSGASATPIKKICWVIPLTILMLGMAFTQARGPWIGLAAQLTVFLALLGMAVGWHASLRALLMSAAAVALTWAVATFIPPPTGGVNLAPRALSAGSILVSTLTAELPSRQPSFAAADDSASATPGSMETRLILWKSAVQMALNRPWFQPEDRPLPLSLHLFGYGPEFFQYLFPLIHPRELSNLNIGTVYYAANEAHNYTLNWWVELGIFGVASHLALLGSVAVSASGLFWTRGQRSTSIKKLL